MTEETTRNAFNRFRIADNTHDVEALAAMYADDIVSHTQGLRGRDTMKAFNKSWYTAFPDCQREYQQVVIELRSVAFRWRMTGTHQADLEEIPATFKPIDLAGCSFLTFNDEGLITEAWIYTERSELLRQLGVA